jgi:transposase InsO family protein
MQRNHHAIPGILQSIIISEPFELIGIDIVERLPATGQGNKFILVITDHFSKWAYAFPMAEITSQAVAEKLVNDVFLNGSHGIPQRILTDWRSNFNSELAQEVYKLFNIAKSTTSAYHPQCDGNTERFNDTLCRMLAKFYNSSDLEWDELLPFCIFNYNTAVHSSTGFTPYYLLFAREPKTPIDYSLGHINHPKPVTMPMYMH